jgi:hypothetical protein
MSTNCNACPPLNCVFPADLELYGLQGPNGPWSWFMVNFSNFPVNSTGEVRVPVPGYGGYEWIHPRQIPNIYTPKSGVFNVRILCCDFTYITFTVPSPPDPAKYAALLQRVFTAVAQKQAYCNRKAKISATNTPKVYSPNARPKQPLKLKPFSGLNSSTAGACVGIPFTFSIPTNGMALPPYQFQVISGGLPPGIQQTENLAGTVLTLSGKPTVVGQYMFTVQVSDMATPPNKDAQPYEIDVMGITNKPPNSNGEIVLTDGNIGYGYAEQLVAGGGTAPYTFQEDPDFPLPDWLNMSPSGTLTGTPPAAAPYEFGVIFTDTNGHQCKGLCVVNVYDVQFTNFGPPGGSVCSPYSFQFTATPAGCTFAGTCPAGLTVNSAGTVSGKLKTTTNPQLFVITATDAHGRTATKTWSIVATSGLNWAVAVQDLAWTPGAGWYGINGGVVDHGTAAGGLVSIAGHIPAHVNGGLQTSGCKPVSPSNPAVEHELGRCGDVPGTPSYQLAVQIAWSFSQVNPLDSYTFSFSVAFLTGVVDKFAYSGAATDSGSHTIILPGDAVSSHWPWNPDNIGDSLIVAQMSGGGGGAQGASFSLDISITPLLPP